MLRVRAIAQARLPMHLADFPEEAGCIDMDILSHCRQGVDHIRGCWAIDPILRKEVEEDSPNPYL
jgi:hypothetical protein